MKEVIPILMVLLILDESLFAQAAGETKNPVLRIITWWGLTATVPSF